MIVYISFFAFYILFEVVRIRYGKSSQNLFFLIGILPLVVLVTLKGSVGTDNISYQKYIELLINKPQDIGYHFEPMLYLLILFFSQLSYNPLVAINLVGLFIIALFSIAFFCSKKHNFILFYSIIPAAILFEYTFNTLRFGLAAGFFILSLSFYFQDMKKLSFFVLFLAMSSHISIIFIVLAYCFFIFDKKFNYYALPLTLCFSIYYLQNIIIKTDAYIGLNNTNIYFLKTDGFIGVGIYVSIILLINSFKEVVNKTRLINLLLILIATFIFVSSQIFPNLIRFNHLLFFFCICLFLYQSQNFCYKLKNPIVLIALLTIVSLSKLNQFLKEPIGPSSFLPYRTLYHD